MEPFYHTVQQPPAIPATPGIYKITCTITKKFYIGSATSLRRRWREHLSDLRRNDHPNQKLQNAWNKYGEDTFVFEAVELVLIPFLLEREQYYLDKLKPFGKKGFNLVATAGSTLGMSHTAESRAKISAANLGKVAHNRGKKTPPEICEKLRQANLGKKASPETRAKLSIAHTGNKSNTGRKLPPEHRAKISASGKFAHLHRRKMLILTDPNGVEYTICGIASFCREHNLHPAAIRKVAKGQLKHHKGWKARRPETDAS